MTDKLGQPAAAPQTNAQSLERETAAESLVGTVMAVQANYYWVKLSAASDWAGAVLRCTRRARLKITGQQGMVGDRVVSEERDWQGQRGAIAARSLPQREWRQYRLGLATAAASSYRELLQLP